ncbi:MAG TPA: PaaI family thioesterase [Acidimicrobiales bacterium]|nr:PaaI family thioesterase [Acidimicrobiales bacterium]
MPIGTPFQQSLGLRWLAGDEPGQVAVELDLRDDLKGPAGSLEGGVVSTIVDVAGASAAAQAVGGLVATQHISISFLAPGRNGPVRATGTPLRVGKSDAVVEVRVVDLGRDDRLMAVALVTVKVIDPNWTSTSSTGR